VGTVHQISSELDGYVKFCEKLVEKEETKFSQIYKSSISLMQIRDRNGNHRAIDVSDLVCFIVKDTKRKILIYHPGMLSLNELEKERRALIGTLEKILDLKKDSFGLKVATQEDVKVLKKQKELETEEEIKNQMNGFIFRLIEIKRGIEVLIVDIEKVIPCYENAIYYLAAGLPVDISKALEGLGMPSLASYQGIYDDLKMTFNKTYPYLQNNFSNLMRMEKTIDPELFQIHLKALGKEVSELHEILIRACEIWENDPWDRYRDRKITNEIFKLAFQLFGHLKEVDRLNWKINQKMEASE